jgi:thiol-disulfide isomerase/thioredoxin
MLRTVTKLPRNFFLWNHYTYVVVAVAVFIASALILGTDGFALIDVLLIALVVTLSIVIQRVARPLPTAGLPDDADALVCQLSHSDRVTLLAFESEYCPTCMITNPMLLKLEQTNDPTLRVIRVNIQNELGMNLFKRYDGRMTPTFVLLDKRGHVLMDWILTLPVNRVLFEVKQALR